MTSQGPPSSDVGVLQQFKRELSDVLIIGYGGTQEEAIQAHKIMLAMKSKYFLHRLNSSKDEQNNNEIQVPEIAHPALVLLIDYIYSEPGRTTNLTKFCTTEGTCEQIISLINGAKLLELDEVLQVCDEVLKSVEIGMDNCLELLHYADLLHSSKLIQITLEFITNSDPENINELIGRPGFLHVNRKNVEALLSKLSTTSPPRQLLQMIINWWKHDGKGRRECAEHFLKLVPLSEITQDDAIEILVTNTDDQFKFLLFEPLIKQLFNKPQHDHPSRKLGKSAFLDTLKLQPVSSVSSSSIMSNPMESKRPQPSSILPKPVKRKRPQQLNTSCKPKKIYRSGRRHGLRSSSESSTSSSSSDSSYSPSSRNQVSSTTTSQHNKSHCILYFIGNNFDFNTSESPKYYIWSFDLETGESKKLKQCSEQDHSALVYYNNAIYIVGAQTYETREFTTKPIVDGHTDILDLNHEGPTWRNTSSIPPMTPRICDFQAAILNDTIYAIGGAKNTQSGQDFNIVNTIMQFSPDSDAVAQGWTPFQGSDGLVMSHRKCTASIAVVDDKIYSIGGFVAEAEQAPSKVSDKVECFHPAGSSCVVKASLPDALVGVATAVLGSKIFCLAGGKSYSAKRRAFAHVYDTKTDTWSPIQPMIKRRAFGSAIGYKGCVFAIGGDLGSTIEKYDPNTDKWEMWAHSLPRGGKFWSVAYNVHEV